MHQTLSSEKLLLKQILELEKRHAPSAKTTDVAGWIQVTMSSNLSHNVISIDRVGINELIKDLLRRGVSALARVAIELIP